jgi:hypothetical protein
VECQVLASLLNPTVDCTFTYSIHPTQPPPSPRPPSSDEPYGHHRVSLTVLLRVAPPSLAPSWLRSPATHDRRRDAPRSPRFYFSPVTTLDGEPSRSVKPGVNENAAQIEAGIAQRARRMLPFHAAAFVWNTTSRICADCRALLSHGAHVHSHARTISRVLSLNFLFF